MTYKTEYEKPQLKESDLSQFRGTENYWKRGTVCHPFIYTDGVKHVVEHGCAFWLLDIIGSYQGSPQIREDYALQKMQFWTLVVSPDQSAVVTCDRDEGDTVISQKIDATDFPLSRLRLWLYGMGCYWRFNQQQRSGSRQYHDYGCLMLPSEY